MADQVLTCKDCGAQYDFTEGEQSFYAERSLTPPKRCKACRDARKSQKNNAQPRMHHEERQSIGNGDDIGF